MNELIVAGPENKRMTSLEISELVEKRHDNVRRTIETIAKRGVIELPQTEEIPTATKPTSVYLLDKRSSLIVVAQLSPEFTARVIDRWQELESQAKQIIPQLPDFTNPAIAARAWADEVEKKLELQHVVTEQQVKISADRPKVEFATAIEDSRKSIKVDDFAKLLNNAGVKIGRNRMFEWLREKRYLMANNKPYQAYIDNRWFSVVEKTRESDNGPVPYIQTMITGKGQIALTRKIVEYFNPIITVGAEARA